jgi:hypothetical protein
MIISREILLLAVLFLFCTTAGLWLMFYNVNKVQRVKQGDKTTPKPSLRDVRTMGKEIIQAKKVPSRFISEADATKSEFPPIKTLAKPQSFPTPQSYEIVETTAQTSKPDMTSLMEEVKNYIKLESWLMALQKANELLHFYPDTPEADKIRSNLSFLIQKVQESKK